MIRFRRPAVLLAAISVLTATTSVHADDRWVLWMKTDYDAALEGDWDLIQAFATREDCVAALQEAVSPSLEKFKDSAVGNEGALRAAETMEQAAARGSVLLIGRGQSRLIRCLPDAVDPQREKRRLR
jgi:hypothetical protein